MVIEADRDRTVSALDVRDDLLELAARYETVVSLDIVPSGPVGRSAPGSRVPPGMQEILDADEITRVLVAVDGWAEFLAHVLVDELEVTAPDATPGRLRVAAEHAEHFAQHEDELLAVSFIDELHDHLRATRRLAGRGVRHIRTGMRCPSCDGHLYSPLGEGDSGDGALHCDKDARHQVPLVVWSSWPRARVKYITLQHAAHILGTTTDAAKMRASRGEWRRVGTGRDTRYYIDDVRGAAGS